MTIVRMERSRVDPASATMRAVRIHRRGGPEVMLLEEVARPTVGPGQVLIAVAAAGVNAADLGQRQGSYPNLLDLPATLGYEVAGTVAAVGPGVAGIEVGARVVALVAGGYADFALVDAAEVVPLPDGVDDGAATAIPIQGITADLLLRAAGHLRPAESVLVHAAAGGVGSLAVQLAKAQGAGTVIGTTRSPGKQATVRALGADLVVSTSDADWPGQVMAATGGRGVDLILDPIGGETSQGGLACLATFGRLIAYGGLSDQPTPFVAQQLIRGCQSISGYNTQAQPLATRAESARRLVAALASGELRVVRAHTFPLAEAAAAHAAVAASRTEGKVVLTVSSPPVGTGRA